MDEHGIHDGGRQLAEIHDTKRTLHTVEGGIARNLRDELDREIQRLNSQTMWLVRDGERVVAYVYVTEDNEVEVDTAGPLVMSLRTTAELQKTLEHAAVKAHYNMAQGGGTYYADDEGFHVIGHDGRLDRES